MYENKIFTCKSCPGDKTKDDFYKCKTNTDGLDKICKTCRGNKIKNRERRKERGELPAREPSANHDYVLFLGSADPLLPYFR